MSARNLLDALIAKHAVLAECEEQIAAARDMLVRTFEQGGKLLLCGNGGSAADCDHIASELLKGFERARPLAEGLRARLSAQGPEGRALAGRVQQGLPAICLTGHPSFASAFANDVEPAMTFAQLVSALGRSGDTLLAISTSGRARNVNLAARMARALGLATIGLAGRDGGELARLCDVAIAVAGETTADIQELHLPVYHYLCRALEDHFFPE